MSEQALQVRIDGQLKELPFNDGDHFDQVMDTVKEAVPNKDNSILKVNLNGEDITGKDWEGFSDLAVGEISTLEIETGDVRKIAVETIDTLSEFIGKLSEQLKIAAEIFRLGDESKAMAAYGSALDGVQLVNHTLALIERNLGMDSDSNKVGSNDSMKSFTSLEPIISDMLSAQQQNDMVLLADLIEYELIPHFEERQQLLETWKEVNECVTQIVI
ncbi:hypothetical protein K9N50_00400 [bacterium]|nr:hypothetical protein [bacterium]